MTSECSSCKRSFDITKSKRTRRTSSMTKPEDKVTARSPTEGSQEVQKAEEEINRHVKLKQFIKVDILENDKTYGGKDEGRALLSQHFTEDKQLQLVIKQPEDATQAKKFKGFVKRYCKALGHLVKSKRGQRLQKPAVLRLTM